MFYYLFYIYTQKAQTSSCLFTNRGLRIAFKVKQTTGNLRWYENIPHPKECSRDIIIPIGIYWLL